VDVNTVEHLDERKHSKACRNIISFVFETLFSFIVCNPVYRYVCDDEIVCNPVYRYVCDDEIISNEQMAVQTDT
jgi:hypothetical protein